MYDAKNNTARKHANAPQLPAAPINKTHGPQELSTSQNYIHNILAHFQQVLHVLKKLSLSLTLTNDLSAPSEVFPLYFINVDYTLIDSDVEFSLHLGLNAK